MYLKGIMPTVNIKDYIKPDGNKNNNENIYDGCGLIANEFKQLEEDTTYIHYILDEEV